jgi:hypothetical protein
MLYNISVKKYFEKSIRRNLTDGEEHYYRGNGCKS